MLVFGLEKQAARHMIVPGKAPNVGIVSIQRVNRMLHNLAQLIVLDEKGKWEYHHDLAIRSDVVTSVSYGDNFSDATYKRWVEEEYKRQVNAFSQTVARCRNNPRQLIFEIQKIAKLRKSKGEIVQAKYDAVRKIAQDANRILAIGLAAAAVAAFTGELALIWVGVAPLGMLGVAAEMTKGLAVTRLYIGLASGVAISYIENQGPPPIDLIAVVHDNGEAAGKNLPSFAADYFEARVSELSKNTIILTKQMIRNAFPNYNRVQIKKLQVVASKTTTAATQTVVRQASMTQRAFSVVGYLMAGWQTVESAQKLGTRLDPNLIEEIFY